MAARIRAAEELQETVRDLVGRLNVPVEVVAEGEAVVQVVNADPGTRPESTLATLYCGGWIACPTALELADRLEIDSHKLGGLVNALNIKIKRCQLGCF